MIPGRLRPGSVLPLFELYLFSFLGNPLAMMMCALLPLLVQHLYEIIHHVISRFKVNILWVSRSLLTVVVDLWIYDHETR
jgi:hypothetical protein